MGKKIYLLLGMPLLAFALIFAYSSFSINPSSSISEGANYNGIVYTSTTGDFEGRTSEPHVGINELVGATGFHNLLTDAGAESIEQILGQGTAYGAFSYIALCNVSIAGGCDNPAAGDTTLDGEFGYDTGGLNRSSGTYGSLGTGYYMIYHTFTADENDMRTNMTGLFNDSNDVGGTMLAINSFTLVTLQSADQLTTNWTINITDGS